MTKGEFARSFELATGTRNSKTARNRQLATIDHIQPRSQGGIGHIMNYVIICAKCNSTKSNQSAIAFIAFLRANGREHDAKRASNLYDWALYETIRGVAK
jgi:HNH endonuclease